MDLPQHSPLPVLRQSNICAAMDSVTPPAGNWYAHRASARVPGEHTQHYVVMDGKRMLPVGEVLQLWRDEDAFRQFFTQVLAGSSFSAFFWETPPLTRGSMEHPFEFVLVESTALTGVRPDPAPFAKHFAARGPAEILSFPNLGGDAQLVVPAPVAELRCYTHLAVFLRKAPASQSSALWQVTAKAVLQRVSDSSLWLSTAGLGVSWLHLRLDSRPKYYRYVPYKTPE
jgi:hypothetical protein